MKQDSIHIMARKRTGILPRPFLVVAVIASFVVLHARRAEAQQWSDGVAACNKLIEHGIYDTIVDGTSRTISRRDFSTACSRMQEIKRRNTGAELEATYLQYGGTGTYTADTYEKLEQSYCAASSSAYDEKSIRERYSKLVSAAALAAWERCLELVRSPSIQVSYSMSEDRERITIKVGTNVAPGFRLTGLDTKGFQECSGDLKERWRRKTRIGDEKGKDDWATLTCSRKRVKPKKCTDDVLPRASITVRTSLDGKSWDIGLPAERQGCPPAGCSPLRVPQHFGEGSSSWQAAGECGGIPDHMRTWPMFGAGDDVAIWACSGFAPDTVATVAMSVTMRGIRKDRNQAYQCHCNGGESNSVRMTAQLLTGADLVVGSAGPSPRSPTESCTGGTDGLISGTVTVPASGFFTLKLRVTECQYRADALCRFVDGTNLFPIVRDGTRQDGLVRAEPNVRELTQGLTDGVTLPVVVDAGSTGAGPEDAVLTTVPAPKPCECGLPGAAGKTHDSWQSSAMCVFAVLGVIGRRRQRRHAKLCAMKAPQKFPSGILLLLTIALVSAIGRNARAQDIEELGRACSAVLVPDELSQRHAADTQKAFRDAMCGDWFSSHKELVEGGGSVSVIEIVRVDGQGRTQRSSVSRAKYCQDQSAQVAQTTVDSFWSRVVPAGARDNWLKCMEMPTRARPFVVKAKVVGDAGVALSMVWDRNANPDAKQPLFAGVDAINLSCKNVALLRGRKIPSEGDGLAVTCSWRSDDVEHGVFIVRSSNRGAVTATVQRQLPEQGRIHLEVTKPERRVVATEKICTPPVATPSLHARKCGPGCDCGPGDHRWCFKPTVLRITARGPDRKLRDPSPPLCVTDNDGSCAWNRLGAADRWHIRTASDTEIEGRALTSSRRIALRMCAMEDRYDNVPVTSVGGTWTLRNGYSFIVEVATGGVGVLKVKWANGSEEAVVAGQSSGKLRLISGGTTPERSLYTYRVAK